MSEEEQENGSKRGFVVSDRRGRSDEEEPRADEASSSTPEGEGPPASASKPHPGSGDPALDSRTLPRIDFPSFMHSIAISALYHLGLVADRETGKPVTPNLDLARENIDILEMLQEKTRGNLEPEEAQVLEDLLYELRMRFVESKRSSEK